MKTIIIFYSLDGGTKNAAEIIAKELDADTLQLDTIKSLPDGKIKFFTGGGQVCLGICPKLKDYSFSPDDYDRIILGTPIWAGKYAPAIRTFLKSFKAAEKVTAVFTSSGSGNNEGCINALKKQLPGIKHTVSLVDKTCPGAENNSEKLQAFINELK